MSSSDPFGDFGPLPDEPSRRFEVREPSGRLVAIQFRRPDPVSGGKLPWWTSPGDPGGLGGTAQAELPLYRCERLRQVPLEVAVVVTEGAADCEAVSRAHIPAVGTMTGAGGLPCSESLAVLRQRVVILWPDNDDIGRSHMERLADALDGVAREVWWLEVPGLPKGGGADDLDPDRIAEAVRYYARRRR